MTRHAFATPRRVLTLASLLALAASALLVAPVAARTPVDPNTLNPPPPDFFNAQCFRSGNRILCDLAFADPANPIIDEPSGIVCGSTELLVSQNRWVAGRRTYSAAGDLLKRHFREWYEGSLTNPVTHRTVPWVQDDVVTHVLAVPGDQSTGTITYTGLLFKASGPKGRAILKDVGSYSEDAATGAVVARHGRHRLLDYFVDGDTSGIQPLCDALD